MSNVTRDSINIVLWVIWGITVVMSLAFAALSLVVVQNLLVWASTENTTDQNVFERLSGVVGCTGVLVVATGLYMGISITVLLGLEPSPPPLCSLPSIRMGYLPSPPHPPFSPSRPLLSLSLSLSHSLTHTHTHTHTNTNEYIHTLIRNARSQGALSPLACLCASLHSNLAYVFVLVLQADMLYTRKSRLQIRSLQRLHHRHGVHHPAGFSGHPSLSLLGRRGGRPRNERPSDGTPAV
mmetsp:Transcript_9090/g.26076  ORF Transcript_9090/g.26076 Transcript_9090/m.26076 type:complete len:238 (+) Transcript_9090:416-1129(+)